MILRLSTLIQQVIQDHQQIISLYSECLLLETRYLSQDIKACKTALQKENTGAYIMIFKSNNVSAINVVTTKSKYILEIDIMLL